MKITFAKGFRVFGKSPLQKIEETQDKLRALVADNLKREHLQPATFKKPGAAGRILEMREYPRVVSFHSKMMPPRQNLWVDFW